MDLTLEQLKRIFPRAGRRAEVFVGPINTAMDEFGIDTPLRQAAFLAQIGHESGQLYYVEEIASGNVYTDREDLGNTRPEAIRIAAMHGMQTGPFYKGHGLIQITGYDNHLIYGRALGIDAVNEPALLTVPIYAARSAGAFWQRNSVNKWADARDIDGVSDVINRGRKTARYGDANGFRDRLALYELAKEVLL